jgi:uncharacterized protein (DUF885 family)
MPSGPFDTLTDEFLTEEFAAFPVFATRCGLTRHDEELPDLSAAGVRAATDRDARWRERLAALPDHELSVDDALDRKWLGMHLHRRGVLRDWLNWRRHPDVYAQPVFEGLHYLFAFRLRDEPDLAAAAAARLEGAADLFDAGRANLDPELCDPILVRRTANQLRRSEGYLTQVLPAELQDEKARRRVGEAAEHAVVAMRDFAAYLEHLAARSTGSFQFGSDRYTEVLTAAEGLRCDTAELRERGRLAMEQLAERMARLARDTAGHPDWRQLLAAQAEEHPDTPEEMRRGYEEWTARARRFCQEADLVTLAPGEQCEVAPAPPFVRAVLAVASYESPPPLSGQCLGRFLVPYPPDSATAEQVRQRLSSNNRGWMPAIAVHEAYPGHHWQLTWSIANCDRLLRLLCRSSYLVEGWGLYAEQLMAEHGFYPDAPAELGQLMSRMLRAVRVVVDTSLHAGEMTVDEAVRMVSDNTGISPETARAEVERYCAWPTQAPSYLTGATEIERLRDEWLAAGRGSLREFHDRLGALGGLSISLVGEALAGNPV